jgi:hypothetical protein
MSALDNRRLLPVWVLLLAQVGLYIWMAPRGFEFTDESYYFLNYLYWRELIGTMSFFGAYFELPFRLLGESIAAIRIFSLALLLVSSGFFVREVLRYCDRRDGEAGSKALGTGLVLVGMASSLNYFGYLSTVRAPSYNLLTLSTMLLSTGLLLRLLDPALSPLGARVLALCYGLLIGACGLGKATSGVLLVLSHVVFFALVNHDWRLPRLFGLLGLSIVGASLNMLMLQWAHPRWFDALLEGVAMVRSLDGRGLIGLANGLRWDIQRIAPSLLLWGSGVTVVVGLLARRIGAGRANGLSVLIVVIVGVVNAVWMWDARGQLWLPVLGLGVLLLWLVEYLLRDPVRWTKVDATALTLFCLLLALPIAFSFGTNMSILKHSQMAAVFVVVAVGLRLRSLCRAGLLGETAFYTCLAVLCVPTLLIQVRAASDIDFTYRQLSSLGSQTMPVSVGKVATTVLVDSTTRDTLRAVIGTARAAGFAAGTPVLDFTGDGPGLVYALGGRPLGTAWLLGGYSGSGDTSQHLLSRLPVTELQTAWLLTSDNNSRAIKDWQPLLDARLGVGAHVRVANVVITAPYRWAPGAPGRIDVQIWRPRTADGS